MIKRVTIKDIAKLAGVNPSTVSRALHDHPDIRPDLIARIKEISGQLKYIPNINALSLKSSHTDVIGLIVPDITMFYFPSIMVGVSAALQKSGYKLMILSSQNNPDKEIENVLICCHANVRGILMSVCSSTQSIEQISVAQEFGIPVVLFDKTLDQNIFDEVLIEDEEVARNAVQYLIDQNCKKIVCLMGNENQSITQKRKFGITKLLQVYPGLDIDFLYANNSLEANKVVKKYISEHEQVDGIFAMSDEVLLGLNKILSSSTNDQRSFKIVSISEGLLPKLINYPIAYFMQDGQAMANKAVEVLLNRLKHHDQILNPKKELISINFENNF